MATSVARGVSDQSTASGADVEHLRDGAGVALIVDGIGSRQRAIDVEDRELTRIRTPLSATSSVATDRRSRSLARKRACVSVPWLWRWQQESRISSEANGA